MNAFTGIRQTADADETVWSALSYKEKNWLLFLRQKTTLDTFLDRGAISRAQHDESLHDLVDKMGVAGEFALQGE